MSYEVLARKWRPQVFEDVIGQEHITQTLINAIKSGRLAHAYLFSGPRGIGKTSVARILAKAMNCTNGEPGVPCNHCQSCVEITEGSSVDVQEIDGASNRGIDEIRELRENVKYMPSSSNYRVYIIDEVHMLTLHAFNALLKTLEEPPGHVKFIFATTETHKVPVTILSRCQRFDFKKITLPHLIAHLKRITTDENIQISPSGLALIAREAEGCVRDAQSLLDQVISFAGQRVEDAHVIEILGVIDRHILFEASGAIIEGSPETCLRIVEQIYNYGYDIKEFYKALMGQFRNLLVSVLTSDDNMLDITDAERDEARRQARLAGIEKLQIILNFLIQREQGIRFASSPRLILETTMIRLCHVGDFLSFDGLLEKISSLEKRLLSAAPSGEMPSSDHISDPAARWVSVKAEKKEVKHEQRLSTNYNNIVYGKDWVDFLDFLKSKSPPIYNVLKDWEFLNLSDGTLEIARASQAFSSAYFDDKDRFEQLASFCREFFQKDILVKIVKNNQTAPQKGRPSKKEVSGDKIPKNADLPRHVQEVLKMFEGDIKDTRQ
ncbi:DNA polymerase III, subunit gamma and tau [uncultured Desulfobacterium sp.]|uniref:DNA polymerase III subunit gamma/tau n=1 Tax=uncultured Desulfobacterium sp. TaxID=201089 RepID=A0A445N300_9BACT|nr:DNA polymerase III, subunit gamma and tau [uncultured Desulfobacterium sp.]